VKIQRDPGFYEEIGCEREFMTQQDALLGRK
jgi:hypothetical protein